MATRRVLLRSKWSTPKATAKEFGLSGAELERITKAVQGFLVSYKGGLTTRNGRSISVVRKRAARNAMKHPHRRRAAR